MLKQKPRYPIAQIGEKQHEIEIEKRGVFWEMEKGAYFILKAFLCGGMGDVLSSNIPNAPKET